MTNFLLRLISGVPGLGVMSKYDLMWHNMNGLLIEK